MRQEKNAESREENKSTPSAPNYLNLHRIINAESKKQLREKIEKN